MSDVVIRVEELGKKFKLGSHMPYHRLSETLQNWAFGALRAPASWLTGKNANESKENAAALSEFWALKEINFEVKQGEVFALIGRNGAGKSTLLKILSRITEPTTGRFGIKGKVASLLEVGTGFHSELTGRENVFLSGSLLGMKRSQIRKRFDEIVDFAGVSQFIDLPVKRYSSGMQVRLGFALAANLEADVLIVDEILAVGDADFQTKSVQKMSEMGQSGRTVLFVSHNMSAVQRLCHSGILLEQGKIIQIGKVEDLLYQYLSKGGRLVAEKTWDPPIGNDVARLSRARILNANDQLEPSVNIAQPFKIEIDYESLSPDLRTTAAFHITNEQGLLVFSSHDFNNQQWWSTPRKRGHITSTCTIPAHFMNEGFYNVLIAVTTYNPDTVHAIDLNALTFEIVDQSRGQGVRGPYEGPWPGVIRPMFDWSIKQH